MLLYYAAKQLETIPTKSACFMSGPGWKMMIRLLSLRIRTRFSIDANCAPDFQFTLKIFFMYIYSIHTQRLFLKMHIYSSKQIWMDNTYPKNPFGNLALPNQIFSWTLYSVDELYFQSFKKIFHILFLIR